jgi:hypothetical protein
MKTSLTVIQRKQTREDRSGWKVKTALHLRPALRSQFATLKKTIHRLRSQSVTLETDAPGILRSQIVTLSGSRGGSSAAFSSNLPTCVGGSHSALSPYQVAVLAISTGVMPAGRKLPNFAEISSPSRWNHRDGRPFSPKFKEVDHE